METMGFSRSEAGNTLIFTSLGFIVGCLVVGKVSDHVLKSRKKTLLAGQTLLLLLMTITLGPAESLPRPLLAVAFFLIGVTLFLGDDVFPPLEPAGSILLTSIVFVFSVSVP